MTTQERKTLYDELSTNIGRTPLVRFNGEVPNGNVIFLKRECDNPFGSHYDRVYLALFNHYENTGQIKPGDKVIETTSGAAGVSFAGIGGRLGYDCYVVIPAGGEKAREEAIKRHLRNDGHLILTPSGNYVAGFPSFLKRFLPRHRDYFFLNHSMGQRDKQTGTNANNEVTLNSLEGIAEEVLDCGIDIHYFVPAVGNGSSVLGPGRVFKRFDERLNRMIKRLIADPGVFSLPELENAYDNIPRTKTIAFETFQSAVAFELLHPGEYKRRFDICPGTLSRHRLPGTSFQGIDFPHIRNSIVQNVIDEVVLVSDIKMDEEYKQLTGKDDTKNLPHWDVKYNGYEDLGRSTRAGISVALDIAKRINGKNLLIIGYDKSERYDK